MALVLKDRVKETSVSTGTGAFTLGGAVGPYQSFSTIGNGNQTYYAIVGQTTTEWEVGVGTYTSSTDSISRDTILASSNSNTIVTFSAGTKDVFITYPSEKAIYEEPDGDTLINAGPITVLGPGVGSIPTPYAETLGRFYGNQDSYQQIYIQNQYNGVNASADIVAYNNLGDGTNYFIDMGMAGSTYSSMSYPIFSANCAYVYNSGLTTGTGAAGETSELLIGTGTLNSDLVLFTGGVNTTNEAVRISGADQTIEVQKGVTLNETLDVTGAATFGSTVLLDADPTLALQAATKQYVDTAVSTGLHLHQPVLVATTGNLTASYNNGTAGVGATLTNSGTQVALAIDGINMTTTNRVLVWQQSSSVQNGIYDVTTVGSGSTNWVLTRSSDANTYVPQSDTGLGGGDYFFVQSGTLGAGDSYVCTNDGVIVFGTTPITFAQFSGAITYTGGTNIDVTGQVISLTGTVAATNGGTGVNTVTTGDLLYGSASNTWSKLGVGTAFQSLVVNGSGTQVEWNAVNLSSAVAVTGTLGATYGGTGQTAYATGDMLYSSATNTIAKLSGNTSTTKQYLSQTGTGSASAAPSWATISAADIGAGTLPATRGGTDNSSYAVGDLLYADTTTSLARLADVATGNVLISGGVSTAPAWGKVALASAVSGTLGITNGGTGQTTANTAFNALAPSQATNSGKYLTTNGTDTSWATVTQTTFSAGTTGFTPSTATSGTVTLAGTLNIANGGTGEITRQAAMDALAGATTSGYYLRGNGTDVVMAAIVAGDVPTLNQNTTGTAGNVTGTVAVINGGTGSTTAGGARTNLGATTVGSNFFTLTNPSAITFPRINADNTVSTLDAATFRTAIGAGTSSTTGTVTSVAALTIGTAGTDLASTVANGTTTPVITLNVPTASATNRGALSSADWTTFNNKGSGTVTSVGGTGTVSGITLTGTVTSTGNLTLGGTLSLVSPGAIGSTTASTGAFTTLTATGNVTAFFSDDRLKTRHGKIENALDKVQTLDGFYYTPNQVAQDLGYEAIQDVGVSAQAVQAILPEIIAPAPIDSQYMTVRYEKLVPLLIEAIKELKAEVDELKKAK